MRTRQKHRLPLRLVALDAIGTVLLGVGLAEWFAGTALVPATLRFDNYPVAMVAAGALLMLPLLTFILRMARERSTRKP
jgi:hypothetical protein